MRHESECQAHTGCTDAAGLGCDNLLMNVTSGLPGVEGARYKLAVGFEPAGYLQSISRPSNTSDPIFPVTPPPPPPPPPGLPPTPAGAASADTFGFPDMPPRHSLVMHGTSCCMNQRCTLLALYRHADTADA